MKKTRNTHMMRRQPEEALLPGRTKKKPFPPLACAQECRSEALSPPIPYPRMNEEEPVTTGPGTSKEIQPACCYAFENSAPKRSQPQKTPSKAASTDCASACDCESDRSFRHHESDKPRVSRALPWGLIPSRPLPRLTKKGDRPKSGRESATERRYTGKRFPHRCAGASELRPRPPRPTALQLQPPRRQMGSGRPPHDRCRERWWESSGLRSSPGGCGQMCASGEAWPQGPTI